MGAHAWPASAVGRDGPRPRRGSLDDVDRARPHVGAGRTVRDADPRRPRRARREDRVSAPPRSRPASRTSSHLSRGEFDPDTSGYFNNVNRNKRSITAEPPSTPRASTSFLRLAERADVVIENFSAGALDRMGIGAEVLRAANPRLIVVSMSGPRRTPGRGAITCRTPTPSLRCPGSPRSPSTARTRRPIVHGLADIVAGHHAALATLAALIDRRRTGSGCVVDLSELEAMAAQIGPGLLALTASGMHRAAPDGRSAAPEGVYRCLGPDRWVAVTVPDDAAWQALCAVIGTRGPRRRRPIRDRGRAARAHARDRRRDHGVDRRRERPRTSPNASRRRASRSGAVQDGRDLVEHDPQLRARGFYRVFGAPTSGAVPARGHPDPALDDSGGPVGSGAAARRRHRRSCCETLGGYTLGRDRELRAIGSARVTVGSAGLRRGAAAEPAGRADHGGPRHPAPPRLPPLCRRHRRRRLPRAGQPPAARRARAGAGAVPPGDRCTGRRDRLEADLRPDGLTARDAPGVDGEAVNVMHGGQAMTFHARGLRGHPRARPASAPPRRAQDGTLGSLPARRDDHALPAMATTCSLLTVDDTILVVPR